MNTVRLRPYLKSVLTMTCLSSETNSILLLRTDEAFSQQASADLPSLGFKAIVEPETSRGWAKLEQYQPAMVVVDLDLAGESGVRFCQRLRGAGNRIPVLMLLQTETVAERVACLESGADDYLLKPYRKESLLNLIQLYLRPKVENKEQLRFHDLILDLTQRRALRQNEIIELTMKEFELLKYLMSNPHKILTREEILENVWGYGYQGESNVIEVYIRYLRLKLETQGQKRLIQTVRGVGYVLREA